MVVVARYQSPVGELLVGSCEGRLCLCDWTASHRRRVNDMRVRRCCNAEYQPGISDVIRQAITQLDEYFDGRRREFSVPVLFTGTEFQCRVWSELMKIPYGVTISYADLALRIGNPKAVRAVASANASNPVSIVVPCHRVIGGNNRLVGYAGGLDTKRSLLDLEARVNNTILPIQQI